VVLLLFFCDLSSTSRTLQASLAYNDQALLIQALTYLRNHKMSGYGTGSSCKGRDGKRRGVSCRVANS